MSVSLSIPDILSRKRDGMELTTEEIHWFIEKVVSGEAQDCQIGAMLMAIFIRGMSYRETVDLTSAMIQSGEVLSWDESWTVADKHSTGGVGDKVSLCLTPALACFGLKVPMVTGRGLEFTGGTLDKLESIPGFNVNCTIEEMRTALREVGCVITGPTQTLAPGDKELYKRRDVTATVASMPLIVASIISKKAAEGTKSLVMDIKVGKAAFFKEVKQARELAENLINVSAGLGVTTKAVLTQMNAPIGHYVGNALEVAETIECLSGNGPPDLVELVCISGGLLLQANNLVETLEEGQAAMLKVLNNNEALECFRKMMTYQGVSLKDAQELCHGDMWKVLPSVPPEQITTLKTKKKGAVISVDALEIATACWWLGAGRSHAEQAIDHRVGVKLLVEEGNMVEKNQPWVIVYHATLQLEENILSKIENAISICCSSNATARKSCIIEVV